MTSRYEKNEKKRKKSRNKKRKSFFKKFLIFIFILIVFLACYGRFVEPYLLSIKEYKITNESIPSSFDGVKIVQFSDVHYGTGFDEKRLSKLTRKINMLKPDIVVFTGDLIDKEYKYTDDDLKTISDNLFNIDSKLGKYAITGEHDFYNNDFNNIMYDSGFKVLKNNYDLVYNKTNKPIVIYGFDNTTYGNPKADALSSKIVNNIPYKIILVHEGDYVSSFVDSYDTNLILAGHSHNGQFKLPYVKPFYLVNGAKEYYDNFYDLENSKLYISSGVGNTCVNFRLFDVPSINVYRLSQK